MYVYFFILDIVLVDLIGVGIFYPANLSEKYS